MTMISLLLVYAIAIQKILPVYEKTEFFRK